MLDELVARVQSYNPQADVALIRARLRLFRPNACRAEAHVGRALRNSSAERRADHRAIASDLPSIVTGLLHDVIEDTGASLDE